MGNEKICMACNNKFIPKSKGAKYCDQECYLSIKRVKKYPTSCAWCGEPLKVREKQFKKYKAHYCSAQHRSFSNANTSGGNIKQMSKELKVISWSNEVAYLIGLIATDGTLRKNRKQIKITSKDKIFMEKVTEIIIKITGRTLNVIHEKNTFKDKIYDSFSIQFTSHPFYDFCLNIGLIPNKTYTIGALEIPDEYFSSFLKGVIDGDGNYSLRKKEELMIRIYSGSKEFLEWINLKCLKLFNIHKGAIFYNENELGSKYILFFMRVYDNLILFDEMFSDKVLYYDNKIKKIGFSINQIDEQKEKYKRTDLKEKLRCANQKCSNTFVRKTYHQKYCNYKCRKEYQ